MTTPDDQSYDAGTHLSFADIVVDDPTDSVCESVVLCPISMVTAITINIFRFGGGTGVFSRLVGGARPLPWSREDGCRCCAAVPAFALLRLLENAPAGVACWGMDVSCPALSPNPTPSVVGWSVAVRFDGYGASPVSS